jgi:phage/plasmid-associated DNA primase
VLELKTKQKLASDAHKLASGWSLVRWHGTTYIPADYETGETAVTPDKDRTIWLPLNKDKIRRVAAAQFDTLFSNESELSSFDFMVAQQATPEDQAVSSLLVRTQAGLMELDELGQLTPATGEFRPNTLVPMLNDDDKEKERVFDVVSGWLNSDEEAESLLTHLATSLAPGWSAVKYVLLLGEGRNGKSLLLKMLQHLFGGDNVSHVTRQMISEQSPTVTELNGKLLNIVYDGMAEYLKDSGAEKTLIAGEPFPIRLLYSSSATPVQTTALFLEGLQQEPKTKDKSTALQKRLVRYQFPNVYPLNHRFEKSMLNERTLGAFLSLLIDRYVVEDVVAERLAPTHKALELQLDQMYHNSMGLQFLKWLGDHDPLGTDSLIGAPMADLVSKFQSWRLKENDLGTWAEPDVQALFVPLLHNERRTQRIDGQPRKVRVITSYKDEALAFIKSQEGDDEDAALLDALVED